MYVETSVGPTALCVVHSLPTALFLFVCDVCHCPSSMFLYHYIAVLVLPMLSRPTP